MLSDMALEELSAYAGLSGEPDDFDAFWRRTLDEARSGAGRTQGDRLERVATPVRTVDTYDLTFDGWGGQPVRAWVRVPRGVEPGRTVVQFVGYGCGRGHRLQDLLWPSAGYVHVIVDNRGSGARGTLGATGDLGPTGPSYPGLLTRGILDPDTFYYRRVLTDAVLAVDAAARLPFAESTRIGVFGHSQGGGMALAAAALNPLVRAVHARAPFLSDFRRAVQVVNTSPYAEITGYLAIHHGEEEQVFRTLSYVDAMNFARRIEVPGLFSVGLCDDIVPPSTVFAAHRAYAGPKELRIWEFNGHEAGGVDDDADGLEFFERHLGLPEATQLSPAMTKGSDHT